MAAPWQAKELLAYEEETAKENALRHLRHAREKLDNIQRQIENDDCRVLDRGHSLGGDIASLANAMGRLGALRLSRTIWEDVEVVFVDDRDEVEKLRDEHREEETKSKERVKKRRGKT